MAESAAHLVEAVIGDAGVRHWVLSLPMPLRYLLAHDASMCSEVLGVFVDTVFAWLRKTAKRELKLPSAQSAFPGAVTVIQRASSHLALNIHFLHAAGLPRPAARLEFRGFAPRAAAS